MFGLKIRALLGHTAVRVKIFGRISMVPNFPKEVTLGLSTF